jgi:pimeloyl-ACP methyl ester carboxylesterase
MATSTSIRCAYVDTPSGQLHLRTAQPAGVPLAADIVLLHWAPSSSRMYERLLPELQVRGLRALAFDLPGFGASLRPPSPWGPPQMAQNLLEALASLQSAPFAVLGGHLSAAVAAEMALAAPQCVNAVVLDGVYACTPEENKVLLAPYAGLSARLQSDGSHKSFMWRATEACMHEWNPRFTPNEANLVEFYAAMRDYLQMGYEAIRGWLEPAGPAPAYDPLARIAALTQPILVLTAVEEALRPCFERTLEANARARGHEFSGIHPLLEPGRSGEYAQRVHGFLQSGS